MTFTLTLTFTSVSSSRQQMGVGGVRLLEGLP